MIDHLDKQTQPLPLDQKRGRGRPATGKALSNAERQRAYRERQKAQRNEKSETHEVPYEEVVAIAQELGERCKAAEAKLRVELELGEKARKRVKELESQLAKEKAKASKAGPTKRRYILQWQDPEKGTWHDDSTGDYGSKARADAACKAMNKDGFSQMPWRVRERQWV